MNLLVFLKKNLILISLALISLLISLINVNTLFTLGGDQGKDLLRIYDITKGDFALLGQEIGRTSSSTFFAGPFYYYLLLPFLLLTKMDPIGAAIPMIFARIFTVVLTFLIAQKLFSKNTAIFTALIVSFSPYWTNKLGYPSAPYLIVPLTSLIIYLFIVLQQQKKMKKKVKVLHLVLIGFLVGLNTHLHYFGLIIVPSIAMITYLKDKQFKSLSFLFYGFLLAISPLIIFEIKNKFFLTFQFVKLVSHGYISPNPLEILSKFSNTVGYLTFYTFGLRLPTSLSLIIVLLSLYLLLKNVKSRYKSPFKILLLTLAFNLAGILIYFNKEQPHYLAVSFPFIFLGGALIVESTKRLNKVFPSVIILIVCAVLFLRADLFRPNGYTMPEDLSIKEIRGISKVIVSDLNGETFNIASTLDGDSRAFPYRYFLKIYGKNPQSVENYNNFDSLYVVTRDPQTSVRENTLFEIASFQPSYVAQTWNINGDIKLIKLTKNTLKPQKTSNFITIVNPVRSRKLWQSSEIKALSDQMNAVSSRNLKSSWLIAYDNLFDQEVLSALKKADQNQELGAFLEVSEKLATEAKVSYKVADGDYYRPDKVFLSGYSQQDREKLIRTYLKKFKEIFGYTPVSVGAWYIDAYSLDLLSGLGVKSAVTVSDQFDTDAARVWGQYFAYPYYPSKYNSLEPANSQSNKIPIVKIQWAQRDPVLSYGKTVEYSRQSFQANDYINNGENFSYFSNLLDLYLKNPTDSFNQITVGLEVGQEGAAFEREFEKQLDAIKININNFTAENLTSGQFANWYQYQYQGISPSHFLKKGDSFWYMSPHLRLALIKEDGNYFIKDLRFYNNEPSKDYFYADDQKFLDRKTDAVIDQLDLNNQINLGSLKTLTTLEKFDRLTFKAEEGDVKISQERVYLNNQQTLKNSEATTNNSKITLLLNMVSNIRKMAENLTDKFVYSQIDGKRIFALKLNNNRIFGVNGSGIGLYSFDFQTLSKFQSLSNLIDKWEPWIN